MDWKGHNHGNNIYKERKAHEEHNNNDNYGNLAPSINGCLRNKNENVVKYSNDVDAGDVNLINSIIVILHFI